MDPFFFSKRGNYEAEDREFNELERELFRSKVSPIHGYHGDPPPPFPSNDDRLNTEDRVGDQNFKRDLCLKYA